MTRIRLTVVENRAVLTYLGEATLDLVAEFDLRNDVYRRPLTTAFKRMDLGLGWHCLDLGAGSGDVAIAMAKVVGRTGRIYAVDSDPLARDIVAAAAAASREAQIVAITQAAEDLLLPELVDLAFCRFLLMHVSDPQLVVERMKSVTRPGGYFVAQEPITSAGRIDGRPFTMPHAENPDVGALLPALVRDAGLTLVDSWAEAPAGAGPGPVADYVTALTDVDPLDDPIVLPPLVTIIAQRGS